MFADDTNISTYGTSAVEIQQHLNHDLENVHQWLLANRLTLNKEKTEYMIIGSRQKLSKIINEPEIHVGETTIKRVSYSKTLGVAIDKHLTWQRQIENIQTKISKGIGMLRRSTSKTYETRSCNVLKELQWQPLKERLKHKKLFFMHKIRNNKLPISTTNMFDIKTNLRYNLRSNN